MTHALFLIDYATLSAFLLATLVISLTPGPDMTYFLGRTIAIDRGAGMVAVMGAMSGLVIHTFLAAFGLSALLAASPVAFTILKIIGAAYLLWLAIDSIRNGSALSIQEKSQKSSNKWRIWITGLSVNLLNPKIVLFFVTFLPQFVSASDPHAMGRLLVLGGLFIAIGFVICTMIVLTAHGFVHLLGRSKRIARIMDYCFAGIFGAFAIRIALAERL